jgi:hypothetical protein
VLPFPGEAKPIPIQEKPFKQIWAYVSPDGRWVANTFSESGLLENYVRPFAPDALPATGAKWLGSKDGGVSPVLFALPPNTMRVTPSRWSSTGRRVEKMGRLSE